MSDAMLQDMTVESANVQWPARRLTTRRGGSTCKQYSYMVQTLQGERGDAALCDNKTNYEKKYNNDKCQAIISENCRWEI